MCRVIADVSPAEDRNKYLSRLDACVSFAFIVGPTLGGFLAQVNNHFPMYIAGVISGIAMIVALIFLKESNPKVLKQMEEKAKKSKSKSGDGKTSQEDSEVKAIVENRAEEKPKPKAKVRVTKTMILCLTFEFCIKWTINAFASRYGIYLNDKWGVSSLAYS